MIRVPLPSFTEETRQELVKVVKKHAEDAKIALRHIRREFLDELDEALTEDEKERNEKEIQELVDEYNKAIDDEFDQKEQELLKV
jgi:ribosome recycling factor